MTIEYNIRDVEEKDIVTYKSDEKTKDRGLDFALPHLLQQHPGAVNYEHWFFHKHPEAWRGWYISGVTKHKYKVDGKYIVPLTAEDKAEEDAEE